MPNRCIYVQLYKKLATTLSKGIGWLDCRPNGSDLCMLFERLTKVTPQSAAKTTRILFDCYIYGPVSLRVWIYKKSHLKLDFDVLMKIAISDTFKYYTLRKKCGIDVEFLHILRFRHFPHNYTRGWKFLSYFEVVGFLVDCMWLSQYESYTFNWQGGNHSISSGCTCHHQNLNN